MLTLLRRAVGRYRELVLAGVFLVLASYEAFEMWALEMPRHSPLSLAVIVHSAEVALVLLGTWLVLRAWQEKTAREDTLARMVEKVSFARDEERRRIAYDIHDGLAQLLVSAKQHLDTADDLWPVDAERARRELGTGLDRLERAVVETRRVVMALRPSALDALGLVGGVRELLDEAAREGGWSVGFEENVGDARLPPAVETAVFRILQEALVNALRHASAARVDVSLRRDRDWLALEVRDHGRGFAPDGAESRGLGLGSMRERARLLGGTVSVTSAVGTGTSVAVRLPLGAAPDRARPAGAEDGRVDGHR